MTRQARSHRTALGAYVVLALATGLLAALALAPDSSARPAAPRSAPGDAPDFTTIRGDATASLDGHTYFFADDDVHGLELWRSDGTPGGTELFADLTPGDASSDTLFGRATGSAGEMLATRGRVYFLTGSLSATLWWTDGVRPPQPAATEIPYFRSGLIASDDGVHVVGGNALWAMADDETELRSLAGKSSFYNLGMQGAVLDGVVHYADHDDEAGWELWRSDLTAQGTRRVADVRDGDDSSEPLGFVATSTHVYFFADDGYTGQELWVTDGTTAGTKRLTDLATGTRDTRFGDWRAVGPHLWFTATRQGDTDATVWRTSGGEPEAMAELPSGASALLPGAAGSNVLVSQNGTLWAVHGQHGLTLLSDRYDRSRTAALGDDLYFRGRTGDSIGRLALHRATGSPARAVPVRSFSDNGFPQDLTPVGDSLLYFVRDDLGLRPRFYEPAPVRTTLRLRLSRTRVPVGARVRVRATAEVTGAPGGTVVFRDGRRRLGKRTVVDGHAVVRLPRGLSRGRHVVTATLQPTAATSKATARAALKVVARPG